MENSCKISQRMRVLLHVESALIGWVNGSTVSCLLNAHALSGSLVPFHWTDSDYARRLASCKPGFDSLDLVVRVGEPLMHVVEQWLACDVIVAF